MRGKGIRLCSGRKKQMLLKCQYCGRAHRLIWKRIECKRECERSAAAWSKVAVVQTLRGERDMTPRLVKR